MKTSFFRTNKGHLMFESRGALKRFSSCERKEALTNSVANTIIKKNAAKGIMLRTYLCPHCHNWHLTHT